MAFAYASRPSAAGSPGVKAMSTAALMTPRFAPLIAPSSARSPSDRLPRDGFRGQYPFLSLGPHLHGAFGFPLVVTDGSAAGFDGQYPFSSRGPHLHGGFGRAAFGAFFAASASTSASVGILYGTRYRFFFRFPKYLRWSADILRPLFFFFPGARRLRRVGVLPFIPFGKPARPFFTG